MIDKIKCLLYTHDWMFVESVNQTKMSLHECRRCGKVEKV